MTKRYTVELLEGELETLVTGLHALKKGDGLLSHEEALINRLVDVWLDTPTKDVVLVDGYEVVFDEL